MRRKKVVLFILAPLLLSLSFHALFFSVFIPVIDVEKSPVIFCWPEIISSRELFEEKIEYVLPFWIHLPRERFHFYNDKGFTTLKEKAIFKEDVRERKKVEKNYIFLWERPSYFLGAFEPSGGKMKHMSYLSNRGKSLFVFSTYLPSSITTEGYCKDYLRKATASWQNRFFWTETELVIK